MAIWLSSFARGVSHRVAGGAQSPTRLYVVAACLALVECASAAAPKEASGEAGVALERVVRARPDIPAVVAIARDGELLLSRAVSGGPPTDTCAAVGLLATALLQQRLAQSGVAGSSQLRALLPDVDSSLGDLTLSELATHGTPLPSFAGAIIFEPPSFESVLDAVVSGLPDEAPGSARGEASVANLYLLERALAEYGPKAVGCRERSRETPGAHAAIPSPIATTEALALALSLSDGATQPGALESLGDEPLWIATHEEPGTRAFAAWLPRDRTALFVVVASERVDPEPLARDLLAELRGPSHGARSASPLLRRAEQLPSSSASESWRGPWELVPEDATRAERELPAELRNCLAVLVVEPIGSSLRLEPRCLGPFVLLQRESEDRFVHPREGIALRGTPEEGPTLLVGAFSGRLRRCP